MLTYHNDAQLKQMMVDEMAFHEKADSLIKGTYAEVNGSFKGCAVGCSIESLNKKLDKQIGHGDHAGMAEAIGWPEWLCRLDDVIFEGLPNDESKSWPSRLIKAVPIGRDIERVKWKFFAYIMNENIKRVQLLGINENLKSEIVSAIRNVLKLHENIIESGVIDESARSSARSAESVARSAAESAAWSSESARSSESAAESVARSAKSSARSAEYAAWSSESSWSSARSAKSSAYKRYADKLIELLGEA